jgi:hypothetical protein
VLAQRARLDANVDQAAQARGQVQFDHAGPAQAAVHRRRQFVDALMQARTVAGNRHFLRVVGEGDHVLQQRIPVGRHAGRAELAQRAQAVFDAGNDGHELRQALLQGVDRLLGPAQVRGIEGQVGAHHAQLGDVGRQLAAVAGAARIAGRIERIADPVLGIAHRMVQARQQHRSERLGQHQAVDQGGAGDAQHDLLHAREGDVEDGARLVHGREGDQSGGVPGQHQQIGTRSAVEQRNEQAAADPQRQRQRQQFGRIHQLRHGEGDRDRPQDGAPRAVQTLGAGRTGEGRGDDVRGHHRPERTRQADAHRYVYREHRCRE